MNKPIAHKVAEQPRRARVQPAQFSIEAARQAYLASPVRVDLGQLAKYFDGAPQEVEVCGAKPKTA